MWRGEWHNIHDYIPQGKGIYVMGMSHEDNTHTGWKRADKVKRVKAIGESRGLQRTRDPEESRG